MLFGKKNLSRPRNFPRTPLATGAAGSSIILVLVTISAGLIIAGSMLLMINNQTKMLAMRKTDDKATQTIKSAVRMFEQAMSLGYIHLDCNTKKLSVTASAPANMSNEIIVRPDIAGVWICDPAKSFDLSKIYKPGSQIPAILECSTRYEPGLTFVDFANCSTAGGVTSGKATLQAKLMYTPDRNVLSKTRILRADIPVR